MKTAELIKKHEGLRLTPYHCAAGKTTIGYGHNLDAHGETAPEIITLGQAEEYFQADLQAAIMGCKSVVAEFDRIDEIRQAVLVDMCFNMGAGALSQFRDMLTAIRFRNWSMAAIAMIDSRWATQVPGRALDLVKMMLTGEW
jgi:lysozyme